MNSGDGGGHGTPNQQQPRVQLGGVDRRDDLQAQFERYQESLFQTLGASASQNRPSVPNYGFTASPSVQPNV